MRRGKVDVDGTHDLRNAKKSDPVTMSGQKLALRPNVCVYLQQHQPTANI